MEESHGEDTNLFTALMTILKPSSTEINGNAMAAVTVIKSPFLMEEWTVLQINDPQALTEQSL